MSEKKTLRVGLVGAGRGSDLALCVLKNPDAELIAVCDLDEATLNHARSFYARKGAPEDKRSRVLYLKDYDEMLKMDIDTVIVATEAIYHVPIVIKALEAGKHVLSEIPSINTLEEAYELKAAVKAHPELIYMAAENCCYWAFIETWKKMHDDGEFGEVVYAEAEYLHAGDPNNFSPHNYPEGHWRTFNPAIKYITHELGPLLYILNDRCVSVTCLEPDIVYNPYYPKRKSTGVALIKTEKGAVLRILICFGAYTAFDHNFRICGTRGNIETDRLVSVEHAPCWANLHSIPGTFADKIKIPVTTAYKDEYGNLLGEGHGGADSRMVDDFIKCVLEGGKPRLDVDFAINMSLPGILAHESAVRGGEPIEIPVI